MKNQITKYTVKYSDGRQAIYTMNELGNSFVSLYDNHGKFIKNVLIKSEDYSIILERLEKSVIK